MKTRNRPALPRNPVIVDPPRTFQVWELAAIYSRLGLASRAAERAAIADLRMFCVESTRLQEEAA